MFNFCLNNNIFIASIHIFNFKFNFFDPFDVPKNYKFKNMNWFYEIAHFQLIRYRPMLSCYLYVFCFRPCSACSAYILICLQFSLMYNFNRFPATVVQSLASETVVRVKNFGVAKQIDFLCFVPQNFEKSRCHV